tara:strand:+ start:440 stop:718 length:279 start_codon:yes stop_codon:yes gene_type:complete
MTLDQILDSTSNLTEGELRELNGFIVARLKERRSFEAALKRRTLSEGDKVSWHGRNGLTKGTIIRIKRKKAICQVGMGQNWDVPLNMLSKID